MDVEFIKSSETLASLGWNQLVPDYFPFLSSENLHCLELSQSIGGRSGWNLDAPVLRDVHDPHRVLLASPGFIKNHSNGEYIFDHIFANAYAQYGYSYFPKWVSATPVTPATSHKLLFNPSLSQQQRVLSAADFLNQIKEDTRSRSLSSLHFLFIDAAEVPYFTSSQFHIRHGFQYHWHNRHYKVFEDFLDGLTAKRAKELRRERKKVLENDIEIHEVTGDAITEEHLNFVFQMYKDNVDRKWGQAYLTHNYFMQLFQKLRHQLVIFLAQHRQQNVAMSISFLADRSRLYGRYWGSCLHVPFLHFELCYYRPIEYCIKNQIAIFEAGAQGEHKFSRGFLPCRTYSAHYFHHPEFHRVIGDYLLNEQQEISQIIEMYAQHNPYRSLTLEVE